jgi:SAM-dependent methyltransferase
MNQQLLEILRCPACRGDLRLEEATLSCQACARRFEVSGGVPRLAREGADAETARTAASFGYVWGLSMRSSAAAGSDHLDRMLRALSLDPPTGLVLDAGCGGGVDLARQATRPGAVVGVELSDAGCWASHLRTEALATAHVVQADVRHLPFAEASFDAAYSYGVLHHLVVPADGIAEIARVVRPGGSVLLYLYEDFAERAPVWRALLALVNRLRRWTTRMPPQRLYALCRIASPVVWALLTIPARTLRHVPPLRRFAASLPYRHGTGPLSMSGDLYDRFSAPVEWRYSRASASDLVREAGLEAVAVVQARGWMVAARRPSAATSAPRPDGT